MNYKIITKYRYFILLIYYLVTLVSDPTEFITKCCNDGPLVDEVLDLYCEYLDERARSCRGHMVASAHPDDNWMITRADQEQVVRMLTDAQKADIDRSVTEKLGSDAFNSKDPKIERQVKNRIEFILMAYKHYFNRRPRRP